MLGIDGLWKMFGTMRPFPVLFSRSLPSTSSQPPL